MVNNERTISLCLIIVVVKGRDSCCDLISVESLIKMSPV